MLWKPTTSYSAAEMRSLSRSFRPTYIWAQTITPSKEHSCSGNTRRVSQIQMLARLPSGILVTHPAVSNALSKTLCGEPRAPPRLDRPTLWLQPEPGLASRTKLFSRSRRNYPSILLLCQPTRLPSPRSTSLLSRATELLTPCCDRFGSVLEFDDVQRR